MARLKKKDWLILSGLCVVLCCGGGTIVGLTAPEATPQPATTTAPARQGIADIPVTATPTASTTPTVNQAAVEASRSAAAVEESRRAEVLAEEDEQQRAEKERKQEEEQAEREAAAARREQEAEAEAQEDEDSGSTSVYYKNCTAVRAAGADPIRRDDPGYAKHLDRDGDGVGCE